MTDEFRKLLDAAGITPNERARTSPAVPAVPSQGAPLPQLEFLAIESEWDRSRPAMGAHNACT